MRADRDGIEAKTKAWFFAALAAHIAEHPPGEAKTKAGEAQSEAIRRPGSRPLRVGPSLQENSPVRRFWFSLLCTHGLYSWPRLCQLIVGLSEFRIALLVCCFASSPTLTYELPSSRNGRRKLWFVCPGDLRDGPGGGGGLPFPIKSGPRTAAKRHGIPTRSCDIARNGQSREMRSPL